MYSGLISGYKVKIAVYQEVNLLKKRESGGDRLRFCCCLRPLHSKIYGQGQSGRLNSSAARA